MSVGVGVCKRLLVSGRDLGLHHCVGRESVFPPSLGIVLVFDVFCGFLLYEFAFWLSKPEKEEREWKLKPQWERGGS